MTCRAPTLIVASAADRLLPSLEESGRLVRVIPNSQRVILPNSGHTALLESGISLARIMDRTGFLPEVPDHHTIKCPPATPGCLDAWPCESMCTPRSKPCCGTSKARNPADRLQVLVEVCLLVAIC